MKKKQNFLCYILIIIFIGCSNVFAKSTLLTCNYNQGLNGDKPAISILCNIYSDYSHQCYGEISLNQAISAKTSSTKYTIGNWTKKIKLDWTAKEYVKNNNKCPDYLTVSYHKYKYPDNTQAVSIDKMYAGATSDESSQIATSVYKNDETIIFATMAEIGLGNTDEDVEKARKAIESKTNYIRDFVNSYSKANYNNDVDACRNALNGFERKIKEYKQNVEDYITRKLLDENDFTIINFDGAYNGALDFLTKAYSELINESADENIILKCNYIRSIQKDYEPKAGVYCEIYKDYSHKCYVAAGKTGATTSDKKMEIQNWGYSIGLSWNAKDYVKKYNRCPDYLVLKLNSKKDNYEELHAAETQNDANELIDKLFGERYFAHLKGMQCEENDTSDSCKAAGCEWNNNTCEKLEKDKVCTDYTVADCPPEDPQGNSCKIENNQCSFGKESSIGLEPIPINPTSCPAIFSGEFGKFLKQVYSLIKFAVPIIILGFAIIDFIKAVTSGDPAEMKKAATKLVKRLAIGIAIFVLPTLVELILAMAGVDFGTCGIS